MFHEQYVAQQHQEMPALRKKELVFLGDRANAEDGSDDEARFATRYQEEKIIQLRRKKRKTTNHKTMGFRTLSRKITSLREKIQIKWEQTKLALHKLEKKISIALEFKPPYIISPDGSLKLFWDFICLGIIIYQMVTIPVEISYGIIISESFNYVIIALFIFDILLNFNTAIYIHGNLTDSRKQIIEDYMRLWFWVDLFSTIPYDQIVDGSTVYVKSTRLLKLLKFLRFIKMLKLLRLAKLKIILDKIDEMISVNPTAAGIITFVKLFILILFLGHLLGCVFHFTAQQEDPAPSYLAIYDLDLDEWQIQYVHSLYWGVATLTTIGYGDVTPQTYTERFVGIFLLLVACGGFAFTMNSIGTVLQTISEKSNIVKMKVSHINQYMKKAQLPAVLSNRIRKYLEFIWDSNKTMVLDDLVNNLSKDLSVTVKKQINGKLIGYLDLFWMKEFHIGTTKDLIYIMEEKLYSPNEIIFGEEQTNNALYIISMGDVEIVYSKTNIVIDVKTNKDYFGEIAFFTNQVRTATAQCIGFSTIFSIDQTKFLEILRQDNLKIQKYFEIRHKIIFKSDYSSIKVRCYTCQMDDHVCINCPRLHFSVNASHFRQFLFQSEQYKYKLFVRKDRVDFNARFHRVEIAFQAKIYTRHRKKRTQFYKIRQASIDGDLFDDDSDGEENHLNPKMQQLHNQEQIYRMKQVKHHSALMIISSSDEDENEYEKLAVKKVNDLLSEFEKSIKEQKAEHFFEFSCVPDFDKQAEYKHFQKDNNITPVMFAYKKYQCQGFPDQFLSTHELGIEELKVFAEFYGIPLSHVKHTESRNADMLAFEQRRINMLDRNTKKRLKHIQKPLKKMAISFLVLRAAKRFKSNLRKKQ